MWLYSLLKTLIFLAEDFSKFNRSVLTSTTGTGSYSSRVSHGGCISISMSWLIQEESMDYNVLDNIEGNAMSGHIEQNLIESDREDGEVVDYESTGTMEILPPMDYITLRNISTIELGTSNIITDADQLSIQSGVTIVPSCSSSTLQHEQYTSRQNSSNTVSMIDETDVALSMNANSIDSSILTEFSGSPLLSSVNSCESYESLPDEQTIMDFDETSHDTTVNQPREERMENDRWYNHFESEEEWEKFQEKTKQLLDAVDCPTEQRDEIISQLISLEEQMFWNFDDDRPCEQATCTPNLSWLLEVAALSASIAFAGIVMVRFLKGR